MREDVINPINCGEDRLIWLTTASIFRKTPISKMAVAIDLDFESSVSFNLSFLQEVENPSLSLFLSVFT